MSGFCSAGRELEYPRFLTKSFAPAVLAERMKFI